MASSVNPTCDQASVVYNNVHAKDFENRFKTLRYPTRNPLPKKTFHNLLSNFKPLFPASFTAIDFETASRRPDSACQLGLVKVLEGRMVEQCCWLIRPRPFHFHPANIRIHGISPNQVAMEPEFSELWTEILAKITDSVLVAHNASFDMRVLIATLRTQKLPIPDFEYTCTRAIAKKTWPHQRRFGLKPLSDWLGIRFQHHDALEDAMACAKLLIAAGIDQESASLSDLEKKLRLKRGRAGSWGLQGPTTKQRRAKRREKESSTVTTLPFIKPSDVTGLAPVQTNASVKETLRDHPEANHRHLQRLMIRIEFIRPLADKKVYLSRTSTQFSTSEIERLILCAGATLQENLDESTNLVIQDHQSVNDFCCDKGILNRSARQTLSVDNLIELLKSCSIS